MLPKNSGVYCFKGGREFLYIGKAANLKERIKNHFQQPVFRDNLFVNQISKIGFIKTDSEIEALILEANLIKKYQPKYNVMWRDDKNYFYVGSTKEDFPRIFITHQPTSKEKHTYVGPFVNGKSLKQTLKVLRKAFPYRTCKVLPKHPCLWYQLDRCPAPCRLKLTKMLMPPGSSILAGKQKEMKKTCKQNLINLLKILQGKRIQVLRDLKKGMKIASNLKEFEKAAKIRDQISALERVLTHSQIFALETQTPSYPTIKPWLAYPFWKDVKRELKKVLKIKSQKRIQRIEAYDVSNIQGQSATGSMVSFTKGMPDKNFYRKFKIKIDGKPNDIAMLKEVLFRRFKHPEWGLPDLILIDGGKAQLNAALKVKNHPVYLWTKLKNIKVMSLAKKENKLYIEGQKKPILLKNLPRGIFNLILQLRDEAHRFAISYHRRLRRKALIE